MTSVHKAAKRVTAFLDRRAEFTGVEPEFLLALDGNRFVLRVSDLRTILAAVPEEEDGPLLWFRRDDRMWHAVCGLEVLLVDTVLVCECGATNE